MVISNICPVEIYDNALLSKSEMIKAFKDKTIIYMWFNKITGNVYIGSGWKGNNRLRSYFASSVLTSTNSSLIYKNLIKYGHNNFSLIILEQFNFSTDLNIEERKKIYLERETFYIKWAWQNYGPSKVLNIRSKAVSSLGYKHTIESRSKMSKSHNKAVLVTNILTKELKIFPSIKETAAYFKVSRTKIRNSISKKSVMLNLYLITLQKKEFN